MIKRTRGKRTGSNVIKTRNQFDNLDFQDGFEWNDGNSYPVNLHVAIESLETHNNVVLSDDALRAANNPAIFCILPSNRGTLLWMYDRALDTVERLTNRLKTTSISCQVATLCICSRDHESDPDESARKRTLLRDELSAANELVAALESTLTCTELAKVHNFRSSQPFHSYDVVPLGLLGLLMGYIPWLVGSNETPLARFLAGSLFMILGYILMAIASSYIVAGLIELRSKRLTKRVSRFTTADDVNYLDWDVPGLAWNETLTDTENKEAIVKAIETHNQVVLADRALTAVQQEAKAYYSKKKVVAAAMGSRS